MNTNQILVTGGTGSLGSRVVNRLSEAGDKVRVMSRYRHANTIRGDLLTGEGLEEAVEGVSTIIHCASSSLRKTRQVDVDGTRRLLWAAERAGVSHLLFVSIVGVDRNPYFPYYRMKLETERIIEHSEVPWTILRATQFHRFVLRLIQTLDRLPHDGGAQGLSAPAHRRRGGRRSQRGARTRRTSRTSPRRQRARGAGLR